MEQEFELLPQRPANLKLLLHQHKHPCHIAIQSVRQSKRNRSRTEQPTHKRNDEPTFGVEVISLSLETVQIVRLHSEL
jgi:hypothetical protein